MQIINPYKIIEWDNDGYPTEDSLELLQETIEDAIKTSDYKRANALFFTALRENLYPDYSMVEHKEVRGDIIDVWGYHTGGWSGNESIITTLKELNLFYHFLNRYDSGGHYYFSLMFNPPCINDLYRQRLYESWTRSKDIKLITSMKCSKCDYDMMLPRTFRSRHVSPNEYFKGIRYVTYAICPACNHYGLIRKAPGSKNS